MLIRSIHQPRTTRAHPPGHEPPPTRVRDLVVEIADPDATVADLAEALDPSRSAGPLVVDGRSVPAALPLDRAGIGDGATVARGSAPPVCAGTDPVARIEVVAGFATGETFDLVPGRYSLGRGEHGPGIGPTLQPLRPEPGASLRIDDPTVSAAHALVEVDRDGTVHLTDLGSTNGTSVAGRAVVVRRPVPTGPAGHEIRVGAARLITATPTPTPEDRSSGASNGPRPWHRPPRSIPPGELPPMIAPPAPADPGPHQPIGVLALVASLLVGGVMVVVLGSWTYGLFALLGPVLMVAGALDGRRRRRTTRRTARRRRRSELAALDAELGRRRADAHMERSRRFAGVGAAGRAAAGPNRACWERRPDHADAFAVRIGIGPVPWDPPLVGGADGWADDVAAVAGRHRDLTDAPAGLVLDPSAPIALVGALDRVRALARAIVIQAACAHGPADLGLAVLAGPDARSAWDWTAWLPHARAGDLGSMLAGSATAAATVTAGLLAARPGPDRWLVVIDDPVALAGRRTPARSVLRAAAACRLVPLVLVPEASHVPAACSVVLDVGDDGSLGAPRQILTGPGMVTGTTERFAAEVARALARLDDPEVDDPGRLLPASVHLADLLGRDRCTAAGFTAQWRAGGPDPAPRAVIGVAPDGPVVIDLAADGPHTLVAGTTGAGKSELLRTLITSLAAGSSPDHLAFVLIDFKGGTAFDACAALPHTAGLVTDLDDHLAARALRCLEAEIRYREARLRGAAADDLTEFRRRRPDAEPLPRLVVVVDEFATLATEFPDFVDALVGVAQRGRSLGVHLVLATQRPNGSVSEHIRANTALRVALRVHAPADSTDVIDGPEAAALPRHHPGRALLRLGPGELVPFQTALASAPCNADRRPSVTVRPLGLRRDAPPGSQPSEPATGPHPATELSEMVTAMSHAWEATGGNPPRCPWPAPLPDQLPWPSGAGGGLVLGLADDPERQRHVPFAWNPAAGPFLAIGLPGAGTTNLAAVAILAAAQIWDHAACHIHVIDLGTGDLRPLGDLPHVGAVIGPDDLERHRRLLSALATEAARRRAAPRPDTPPPVRLLVIDGLGAFRARWDELDPSGTWPHFLDVLQRGAAVGIHVLCTAEGPSAAPHQVVSACPQRLVMRLGDRADHAALGIAAAQVPKLPPGRGVAADGERLVQVARPADGLHAAVDALAGSAVQPTVGGPGPVAVLARSLPITQLRALGGQAEVRPDGTLRLPVGQADADLGVAWFVLEPGGHAVVAGPPRSGRSTALATLAVVAAQAGVDVTVVARDADRWNRLGIPIHHPSDRGTHPIGQPASHPTLVLVDDADLLDDDHPTLAALVADRMPHRHVVAAGRSDRLRQLYGHWSREVRADRTGLLLVPDPDLDGELIGTRMPRRPTVALGPGRGWLVHGTAEGFVQVAHPEGFPDPVSAPDSDAPGWSLR